MLSHEQIHLLITCLGLPGTDAKDEGSGAPSKGQEDKSSDVQGDGSSSSGSSTSSPATQPGAQREQELQDIAVSHAATHSLRSVENIFGPTKAEPSGTDTDGRAEEDGFNMDVIAPATQVQGFKPTWCL